MTLPHLILAHGAGAPMDSPFMEAFAEGLVQAGIGVTRFEFPYMAKRRDDGRKRPPDREPVLLQTWRDEIIAHGGPSGLMIGGKSMGGRMASLVAAELGAAESQPRGLLCLGYPFHPPGKPDRLRVDHLRSLTVPTLIIQGERDALGDRATVEALDLPACIRVHWLPDGDHSFKPRKASGHTEAESWAAGIATAAAFIQELA